MLFCRSNLIFINRLSLFSVVIALILSVIPSTHVAAAQPIIFPVIGQSSFSNDFAAPRSNGQHNATDIIAGKHQAIVSATNGTIRFVGYPQPSWGYAVYVEGDDGFTYRYLHMNNDTPGTDDGRGGYQYAYAQDIRRGNRVVKGQLIGWVGDSGNAETTVPHLHFEMINTAGNFPVNPYLSLRQAQRIGAPVQYPSLVDEIRPYGQASTRRANIALGNIDADPEEEIIVGPGPGAVTGPQIQLYNFDRSYISGFNSYNTPNFPNGSDVAAGDVDGDGIDEIITGAGAGTSPSVKVFKADGTEVGNFLAYNENAQAGLSVAAGDVDGDGIDEIITGLRIGAAPLVKIFKVDGTLVGSFNAYLESFVGGIDVASADVSGDSKEEIITGPISNGGPDVRIYNQAGTQLGQFWAYDTTYRSGIRISAGNVRTNTVKSEIQVVPVGATAHLKTFNASGSRLNEQWFIEDWWRTTFDVASGEGRSIGTAGVNRRTTVRLMEY